mgnify:CR=1 FL=1
MNPTRRHHLRLGMGLGFLSVCPSLSLATAVAVRDSAASLAWRERSLIGFGTTLWLRAGDASADKAEAALDRSVQLLRNIESQMSLFDEHSAISRLNRLGELRKPSLELLQIIMLSSKISSGSDGAFDISMQPLWKLWANAQTESRLPTERELQSARERVNWRAVKAGADSIVLLKGMALSLNGIAQGFAADALRSQMQAMGIRHAMLDTGETAVLGAAPEGSPWRFGIEDVHRQATSQVQVATVLAGYAMATSSDAHTSFTNDRVHHHILNPRTGDSPGWWSSVTVVAKSAALADGLTKVFFMLPPSRVQQAAKRWSVTVILQDKQGRWSRVSG